MITHDEAIRAAALYLPIALALLAGWLGPHTPRRFAACLLSLLWAIASLLVLQRLNLAAGWWTFETGSAANLRGMPLELSLGWAVLWGLVPQLAFPRWPLAWVAALMIALDIVAMPLCQPVVQLGPHWQAGEAAAVAIVLVPALCLARWTQQDQQLELRASLQICLSALLFLYCVPELVFALRPGSGWSPLLQMPSWQRQLELQIIALLAVPGVNAVMEFAQRGRGTPIPYDPPKRLVVSGIYRYCANPMQLSCSVVMLLWAGVLRNGWLVLAAAISAIYSAGIAAWDEHQDLEHRFGAEWLTYRQHVKDWRIRWRPYVTAEHPATLYIAATCGPCSEVRAWLAARSPLGLSILDAETLPYGSIRRMTYVPGDGTASAEGVRAMGRALEHLNVGWAISGAILRLPLVWQGVQLVMDASGLGPRIPGASACRVESTLDRLDTP